MQQEQCSRDWCYRCGSSQEESEHVELKEIEGSELKEIEGSEQLEGQQLKKIEGSFQQLDDPRLKHIEGSFNRILTSQLFRHFFSSRAILWLTLYP